MSSLTIANVTHYLRVAISTNISVQVSVSARLISQATGATALALPVWAGVLTPGAPQPIDFPFNPSALAPGTYIGEITVLDTNAVQLAKAVGADPLTLISPTPTVTITSISWV